MSKRLRGSMSVYQETKQFKGFVSCEMFIISTIIGYAFQSWTVWFIAFFVLLGSMGTALGLIVGWFVTIFWTSLVALFLHSASSSLEVTLIFSFLAGGLSWYAHSCGNLWWRDFAQADWW